MSGRYFVEPLEYLAVELMDQRFRTATKPCHKAIHHLRLLNSLSCDTTLGIRIGGQAPRNPALYGWFGTVRRDFGSPRRREAAGGHDLRISRAKSVPIE
jgi:hypothetical protein